VQINAEAMITPAWKRAARAELAVELHVQREQHDHRDQELADDPQDQLALHHVAPALTCHLRVPPWRADQQPDTRVPR
jgi:hypothetical protein